MFGLIKKIFKKSGNESSGIGPVAQTPPAFARTATPGGRPAAPGGAAGNPFSRTTKSAPPAAGSTPSPALNPSAAVSAARTPSAPSTGALPDTVSLPLRDVIAGLTPEFQHLFSPQVGDAEVQLPLQGILPQLSAGRVRLAFGELRSACPNGSCKAGPEHDAKLIELPLASVLSRINPALLPRRSQRRLMDVPTDVTGLFGATGEPVVSTSTTPVAPPPAAPVPPPAAPVAPPVSKPAANRRSAVPEDLDSIPSPFNFGGAPKQQEEVATQDPAMPAPVPPAKPRRSAVPEGLENIPSPFSFPGAPASQPAAPASAPVLPEAEAPVEAPKIKIDPGLAAALSGKSATKPAAVESVPTPAPAPASAGLQAVKEDNYVTVNLSEVMDGWPEAVLAEIQQSGMAGATLSLPASELDVAIRKGRIVFTWKMLRGWMEPAGSATSTSDDVELQLPLKLVAPKFLSLRKPKTRKKNPFVEESIPDLFSGGPGPEAEEAAAAAEISARAPESPAAAPAPIPAPKLATPSAPDVAPAASIPKPAPAAPASVPVPASVAASKPLPPRRTPAISAANPNEMVSKTAQLPSVSGALLAMNDGLVVASKLPKPLQGETVAAFLPQIFSRLTQFSSELKLGDLSTVMLVMDNCPWIIFRTGKVYFAVVGTAGEALPLPQLTAIVADIKRQNL